MKEIRYEINLDVQREGIQQTLTGFRVGDAQSRSVCIHLVERGAAYQVPMGCSVTLYAKKPDGTVSYSMCSVKGGSLIHTFTSGELAVCGEVLCEVRIITGDKDAPMVLSSPQFCVIVEDVLQDDEAIESTNEYSALTQAIAGMEEKSETARQAAEAAHTAAGEAAAAAGEAQSAATAANTAAEEVRELLPGKTTSYVLAWTEALFGTEEYVEVMEKNKPVLKSLSEAEEGSYHVVLKSGEQEFQLSRREYTGEGEYEFRFPSQVSISAVPYEYVVWYKPATKEGTAQCGLRRSNIVNNDNIVENDFRPPTTDLVRMCMDLHENDTDVHITAAERARWNAGTGGGVTYTLSKTGSTIKLAGSDGTEQTVTDSNTTYADATASVRGLMSAADKEKLDGIAEGADNVSFESARTNGTEVGKITINGTETTLWAPMNTHYSSSTVVANSAAAKTNSAAANGSVYLNHIEDSAVKSAHKIIGSGAATVTSDSSGNITVDSTDTTYEAATTSTAGLMSAADKTKVEGMVTNIQNGTNPGALRGILGCAANGSGAAAFGQSTNAAGAFSFAAGSFSNADGDDCFSSGVYVTSSGRAQAVFGKYNTVYDGPAGTSDTTGTQFMVGVGTSANARANAFRVTADGYCRGQNAFTGSGADYAEYFEWIDGNTDGEDRRGYFVTLEGDKIRKATAEDEYILGVVSVTPALIGNTYSDMWQGMYVTDVFGQRLTETVEAEEYTDPATGETVPAHTETRFVIHPDYDPNQPYAGRHERVEWDAVGIVGQLVVIDDGTCEANGYCKVANDGTATKSKEKTEYRVMERLDETHIRIFVK